MLGQRLGAVLLEALAELDHGLLELFVGQGLGHRAQVVTRLAAASHFCFPLLLYRQGQRALRRNRDYCALDRPPGAAARAVAVLLLFFAPLFLGLLGVLGMGGGIGGLHDVVNEVVEVLLVDLFVASALDLLLGALLLAILAAGLADACVVEEMGARNAAAHADASSLLLVLLKLVAVGVVVLTDHCGLLGLLVVDCLFEGAGLRVVELVLLLFALPELLAL